LKGQSVNEPREYLFVAIDDFSRELYADILPDKTQPAYGTENCRRMRQHFFTELSPIAGDLAAHYVKTAKRSSFEQANHVLVDIHSQLRIEDLNLCADHEELLNAAKRFAENAIRHDIEQKNHWKPIQGIFPSRNWLTNTTGRVRWYLTFKHFIWQLKVLSDGSIL